MVAALRFRAKLAGEPSPVGPLSERILAGFRRQGVGRGRGQVAGVGWAQSDATAALAARGGLTTPPPVAVASDTLLRVSELQALEVAGLDFSTSTVTVRRSKTDQEGEGAVLYLGKPTLKRGRKWLEAAELEAGPLFRRIRVGGAVGEARLSQQATRSIIKVRRDAAGRSLGITYHAGALCSSRACQQGSGGEVEVSEVTRRVRLLVDSRFPRSPATCRRESPAFVERLW